VEDVGEAIAGTFYAAQTETVYELAGSPLQTVSNRIGVRRALVPVPFAMWQILASFAEFLAEPPITRNQVELMKIDNVASTACPGFAALGVAPRGIEAVLD
jgi:hypothetical protein